MDEIETEEGRNGSHSLEMEVSPLDQIVSASSSGEQEQQAVEVEDADIYQDEQISEVSRSAVRERESESDEDDEEGYQKRRKKIRKFEETEENMEERNPAYEENMVEGNAAYEENVEERNPTSECAEGETNEVQKPTVFSRVYVGGLNQKITKEELQGYFSSFGKMREVNIKRNKNKGCRGFGFITFADSNVASDVVRSSPHMIGECSVEVEPTSEAVKKSAKKTGGSAVQREPTSGNTRRPSKKDLETERSTKEKNPGLEDAEGDTNEGQKQTGYTRVYVGGLNLSTTKEDLQTYFSQFGKMREVVIKRNKNKGSRAYGFITFIDSDIASEVVSNSPHMIGGISVEVEPSSGVIRKSTKKDIPRVTQGRNQGRTKGAPWDTQGRNQDRSQWRTQGRSQGYSGAYSGSYPGQNSRAYQGEYQRDYPGNYQGNYQGDYQGNSQDNFQGNRLLDALENFQGNPLLNALGNYLRNQLGNYPMDSQGDYPMDSPGNYPRDYPGDYPGPYPRNTPGGFRGGGPRGASWNRGGSGTRGGNSGSNSGRGRGGRDIQKPLTFNRLYLKGLSQTNTRDELIMYFSTYGKVREVNINRTKKQGWSGLGNISFFDPDVADEVIEQSPHVIGGSVVDVERTSGLANSKKNRGRGGDVKRNAGLTNSSEKGEEMEESPEDRKPVIKNPRKNTNQVPNPKEKRVFVGGLNEDITVEDLQMYFSMFGKVQEVAIKRNKKTTRKFGFVTFTEADVIDVVVDRSPHIIAGISVEVERPEQKRTPRKEIEEGSTEERNPSTEGSTEERNPEGSTEERNPEGSTEERNPASEGNTDERNPASEGSTEERDPASEGSREERNPTSDAEELTNEVEFERELEMTSPSLPAAKPPEDLDLAQAKDLGFLEDYNDEDDV